MQSLRKNIGIVQQDIYLFNSSIRENILYGKPDATEEEFENACHLTLENNCADAEAFQRTCSESFIKLLSSN